MKTTQIDEKLVFVNKKIDSTLSFIKSILPASKCLHHIDSFKKIGHTAVLIAAFLGLTIGTISSVKNDSLFLFLTGIGWFFGILIIDYVSRRFDQVSGRLINNTRSQLSSTVYIDAIALTLIVASLTIFFVSAFTSLRAGAWSNFIEMGALAVWLFYIGIITLNSQDLLNIEINSDMKAEEEGVGLLEFGAKSSLLAVPFYFGTGASLGVMAVFSIILKCLKEEQGLAIASTASMPIFLMIGVITALPFLACVGFLVAYTAIASIKSLTRTVSKLEKTPAFSKGTEAPDPKPESSAQACLNLSDRISGGIIGSLVGDALGVPVEFSTREERRSDPVREMRGNGCWQQPKGTWSDDGSLLLCTAEALIDGLNTDMAGQLYLRWRKSGHNSALGEAFDIRQSIARALDRIAAGVPPEQAGILADTDNSNGALMRILPVALRFRNLSSRELGLYAARVAAITHGNIRSRLSCILYCLFSQHLLAGRTAVEAWQEALKEFGPFIEEQPNESIHFARIRSPGFAALPEDSIESDGHVVHTLEAAVWCLLQGGSFKEIVLRAVNLGGDTDTTACVAGGLAGILHGQNAIPAEWASALPAHPAKDKLIPSFLVACDKAS